MFRNFGSVIVHRFAMRAREENAPKQRNDHESGF